MRRLRAAVALAFAGVLAFVASPVSAQTIGASSWPRERPPSPLPARPVSFPPYQLKTLPNGLQVVFLEDHSTPIVHLSVWYHVGSKDEKAGRTGFAHLFEHMMFQGSAHIAKAEHGQLVERAGGSLNANTQYDITRYYNVVPSNRVNLALWLEAERMRSLAVTDENLKNQVAAVKEERRLRVDNAPYGKAIWDPIDLTSRMTGIGVGIALIILTLDTMCCNLAANLVGPAYDFSSLWPKGISYKTGGLITATIAIVMMPWKILATSEGYIFTWLVGYSALLGPVAGIMMVDYFLIRGTRLNARELFDEHGEYTYTGGWNLGAVVALAVGVLPNLPGFLHTAFPSAFPNVPAFFNTLYTYAWFVGLVLAALVYSAWMKLRGSPSASVASA